MKRYLLNILIGIDQFFTTIVGGWPDETLSSYSYRLEKNGKIAGKIFRPFIDRLFFWTKNHCEAAYRDEAQRLQFPRELR